MDLRGLSLTERKRDLHRLCRKSRVPFMREVQTFPNGGCCSITIVKNKLVYYYLFAPFVRAQTFNDVLAQLRVKRGSSARGKPQLNRAASCFER